MDSDKRLVNNILTQIEVLSDDINKENQAKLNSDVFLQQYLDEELPRIRDDIANEVIVRREVEQKIIDQFMEQIKDLKQNFEEEKKERELREEELITILKATSMKIQENLIKTRQERLFKTKEIFEYFFIYFREVNEENVVKLVEQVIDKLKNEVSELTY